MNYKNGKRRRTINAITKTNSAIEINRTSPNQSSINDFILALLGFSLWYNTLTFSPTLYIGGLEPTEPLKINSTLSLAVNFMAGV